MDGNKRRFVNRAAYAAGADRTPFADRLTYEIYDDLNGDEAELYTLRRKLRAVPLLARQSIPRTDRVLFALRNFDSIAGAITVESMFDAGAGHLLYYDITTNRTVSSTKVREKNLRPCMTDREIGRFGSVFGIARGASEMATKRLRRRLRPAKREPYKNDFLFLFCCCLKVTTAREQYHVFSDLAFPALECEQDVRDMIVLYTAELLLSHMVLTASRRSRPTTVEYSQVKLFARCLVYLMQRVVIADEDGATALNDFKNLVHNVCKRGYWPDSDYQPEYDESEWRGGHLVGAERLTIEFLECFVTTTSLFVPFETPGRFGDEWSKSCASARRAPGTSLEGACCRCNEKVFSGRAHLCMRDDQIYYLFYFDFSNSHAGAFVRGYLLMVLDIRDNRVIPSKFLIWNMKIYEQHEDRNDADPYFSFDNVTHVEMIRTVMFGEIGKAKSVPKFLTLVLVES